MVGFHPASQGGGAPLFPQATARIALGARPAQRLVLALLRPIAWLVGYRAFELEQSNPALIPTPD